jgi:hypothetical protein
VRREKKPRAADPARMARRRVISELLQLRHDLRSHTHEGQALADAVLKTAWRLRSLKGGDRTAVQAWSCIERAARYIAAYPAAKSFGIGSHFLWNAAYLVGAAEVYAVEGDLAATRGRAGGRPRKDYGKIEALIDERPDASSEAIANFAAARGYDAVTSAVVRRLRRNRINPGKT